MPARSKARKRAVDIVYESDLRVVSPLLTLAAWEQRADPPVSDHTDRLVRLVGERGSDIDRVLAARLVGWDLSRLPPVDRSVLRVAVAELLWVDDVPDSVVIDEAVELAKSLSSDDAPGFVNGVLARVAADKGALLAVESDGDGAPGVGVEHTPGDQPLGELRGALVVDHGE